MELQHMFHLRRLFFYRTMICNILLNACLQMVRVMVLNATLNNISVLYSGGQFYRWRKPEYLAKTTDLPQIADKL